MKAGFAIVVCLSVLLAPIAAHAEGVTAMVVGHPRLYFTAADLPRLRAANFAADNLLGMREYTGTYFGGKQVVFPLPPQQPGKLSEPPGFDAKAYGHYPYWTGYSGAVQSQLLSLSLSYASTGRLEFARRAREYCLSLAKWSVWTDPDYHPNLTPCLDTGYLTLGVAVAYDVCYDQFSADERAQVRAALQKLGLQPTYEWVRTHQESEFNLEILLNASLGIGALAILGEGDDALNQAYVAQAKQYFLHLAERKLTSPNTEGLGYSSTLDQGSRFADVLRRVTGDDEYFRHPYIAEVLPKWVAYFLGPRRSGCVNFADNGGYPRPFETTLKLLSNNYGNALAGWLLQQYGVSDGTDFEGIIYCNSHRPASPPRGDWPTSAVFGNLGWAALRTGWGDDDVLLAFKCSSSQEGHDHTDQGNFVINVGGTWIATDPGYGSFRNEVEGTYSRGTASHNSLLVDGAVQTARAGKVIGFHAGKLFDYVAGDASKCYDPKKLSRFIRHIVFVKPSYIVMVDDLASEGTPRAFQWLLHTDEAGRFTVDGSAVAPGFCGNYRAIRLEKGTAALNVRTLWPMTSVARYDFWPGTESHYPAFITVSAPEKQARQWFVTVLTPERIAGAILANASFEQGLAGWDVGGEPGSQVAVSADAAVSHTGKQSARLVGTVAQRDRTLIGQWYLPAQQRTLYRASVWCKTSDLKSGVPVIDLTFYGADRKYIAPGVLSAQGKPGTHDWQQIIVEGRSPAEAQYMTFRAGLHYATGTLWFDDAEVVQVDPRPVETKPEALRFELVGDPNSGAFAVRAVGEGGDDTLRFGTGGNGAREDSGVLSGRIELVRRAGGVVTASEVYDPNDPK